MAVRIGLALLLLGFAAWAQTFPVEKLEIVGNKNVSTKEILDALPFSVGDVIDREKVLAGAKALEDLGYFSQVTPEVTLEGGRVVVRYRVVEFPKIQDVVILGVPAEPKGGKTLWSWLTVWWAELTQPPRVYERRVREILSDNGVKPGEVLNRRTLEKALQAVLEEYQKKDMGTVQVAEIIPGERLVIRVEELPVVAHEIRGLLTVPQEEARALIDVPLGEVGRISKIRESLVRLTRSVYFTQAQVIPEMAPGGVKLVWQVTERAILPKPQVVRGIRVVGTTVLPEEQAQALVAPFSPGPMNNFAALAALRPLYDYYRREGYLLVDLMAEKVENGVLHVRVREGELGRLEITGLTRTAEWVVRRALKLQPGQILTEAKLMVARQNLMALGYFSDVILTPTWEGEHVVLTADIKELDKLGSFTGSVNFSPEVGGIVGNLTYAQKNIFGTGQDVSLTFSRGLTGSQETTWSLGYVGRAFPGFTSVQLDLYRREEGQRLTLGGAVKVAYPLADYLDLALGFTKEEAWEPPARPLPPRNILEAGLMWDDRDNPFFPRKGGRTHLSLEKAGTFAPGAEYLAWRFELVRFWPHDLGEQRAALAARALLRVGLALPAEHWFTLGGGESVRGAKKSQTDRFFLLNAEFRVELAQGAWLAPFFDLGLDLHGNAVKMAPGLEIAANLGGMFVRLSASWPNDREPTWVPAFEFGMSPMF